MKAPWLAELKPGDVFYVLSQTHQGVAIERMAIEATNSMFVTTRAADGSLGAFQVDRDRETGAGVYFPIPATPAAHVAYEALKRLWEEIEGEDA